ncbi:MAG: hypothetical protein ACFCUE_02450 [Candidatus Bathyarchaeia archaeon]|jgi:hypothetical protein
MKGFLGNGNYKEPLFQVLLLDNDETLDVQVQEAQTVNYSAVKEHLKNGGSVFITTKKQQKLSPPKTGKAQQNYTATRRNYGALLQKTFEKQNFV